ncbi:hypothetical protein BBW78_08125 [Listeria monocytogenes]|nr:hypothetical protein [Listeria monocytogenes]
MESLVKSIMQSFPDFLFLCVTSLIGILVYRFNHRNSVRQNYSEKALELAFIPVAKKMDTIIFKKFTSENFSEYEMMLVHLIHTIKVSENSLYFPEFFLIYLEKTYKYGKKNHFFRANIMLHNVSVLYWKSFNKCRKQCGIPIRTIDYRIQNNMHIGGKLGVVIVLLVYTLKLLLISIVVGFFSLVIFSYLSKVFG